MKATNNHKAFVLALVLGLVLGTGCNTPNRGTAQNTWAGGDEAGDTYEYVGNPDLAKKLEMVRLRSERRNDRLHVQFELHNKRSSNLAFEWAVEWFDEGGFRIDTPLNWTPTQLGGEGFETIAFVGPTPEASTWRLGVRTPNTVR